MMYEPRDYAIGKFLLKGERGAIADYDYAVSPVRTASATSSRAPSTAA